MGVLRLMTFITLCFLPNAALLAASGGTPKGKPFVELQNQIRSLEERVDSLLTRIVANESRLDGIDASIALIEQENTDLQQQLSDLVAGLTTVEDTIAQLEAEVAALQSELQTHDDQFGEIESEIARLDELIALFTLAQAEGFSVIEARLAENEEILFELSLMIEDAQNQLALKQNLISGSCAEDEKLVTIEADGSLVCDTMSSGPLEGLTVTKRTKVVEIKPHEFRFGRKRYTHILGCQNVVGGYIEVPSSLIIRELYRPNPKTSFLSHIIYGNIMEVDITYEDPAYVDSATSGRSTSSWFVTLNVFCLFLDGEQGTAVRPEE